MVVLEPMMPRVPTAAWQARLDARAAAGSSPVVGDISISFEPEGSGMKLTMEGRPRSFWRFPPLRQLTDLFKGMTADRYLPA